MKSIEVLMHEHRLIEQGLKVLENIAYRLERGEDIPSDKLSALLDFFRVFADQCHHGKEEGMLFPELEKKGIPKEGGPIEVMLIEHEEGRSFQKQMREAAVNLEELEAKRKLVQAARGYIELLRQHIWKEDNVLFKMAEQVLSETEDEQLTKLFERQEIEEIGEGVHERYHQLVHELEAEFVSGTDAKH